MKKTTLMFIQLKKYKTADRQETIDGIELIDLMIFD